MKAPAAVGVAAALLCGSCGKSPQQQAKNSAIAAHTNITVGLPPQTQTSRNPESAITGAEVWKVSGTNYNVQGTSLLTMGNGQTMFIVKAFCDFVPSSKDKLIARSIAKYAVDHGYQAKVKESWWNGVPQQFSGAVGVALMQKAPAGSAPPAAGWRYNFTVAELQTGKSE